MPPDSLHKPVINHVRGTTMPYSVADIEKKLTNLRLHGMARSVQARILAAQQTTTQPLEILATLIQDELDSRLSALTQRRFKASGLDERKLMDGFDWSFNPKLPKKELFELLTVRFIQTGEDALLIGHPGTGKSHCAKAIAHAAIQAGFTVCYRQEQAFFEDLFAARQTGTQKLSKPLACSELLVVDDLFLRKRVPQHAADDLLDVILERYAKKRSTVITSNRPLEDWGKLLGDNAAASAMLDRLLHRGHLLKFEGNSYRLKEASKRLAMEFKKK